MNGSRILGAALAALLATGLGSLVGCADESDSPKAVTAQTVQAASVSLVLHDADGTRIGEGSGILIAPRVVLTSGHLVAGKSQWTVTSADGKTRVKGTRGLTYDWMSYNSNKAHPRKHDIGVIYLDKPIQVSAYPTLSSEVLDKNTTATRVRGNGGSFQLLSSTFDKIRTFPHAYVTDLNQGETLDTGGAVLNEKNEIVGIVTGKGLTTGKLYVARVNDLVGWLTPKAVCGSKASKAPLTTRTYGTPPPKPGCDDAGAGSSGGSSSGASGSSSGSSGSSGDGSSGSSGGGSSGSSGGPDGNCNDGGGGYNSDGTPNGGGGGGSSDGSSGNNGSTTSGSSGTGGGGGGGGSSGGDGTPSGSTSGSSGTSGTSGGAGGSTEVCTGSDDNPDICPPDPTGSSSPSSGGGSPDDTMDYGGCGTCGGAPGDGVIILR